MRRNKRKEQRSPLPTSLLPASPVTLNGLKDWLDAAGADPYATSEAETIVHRAARDMSAHNFHQFCEHLIQDRKLGNLFILNEAKWKHPLHFILSAQKQLEARTLQMILDSIPGINVEERDSHGNTLLLRAAKMGQSRDIINVLIQAGSNINACNKSGENCLHLSAKLADTKPIYFFISLGVTCSQVNKDGSSFLHLCAREGITSQEYHDIISLLSSSQNTEVFQLTDKCNDSPIHKMVQYIDIHQDTMKLFQGHGVNLNLMNADHRSILMCAAQGHRSVSFLKGLLDLGADATMKDKQGNTFAHFLAQSYSPEDYHNLVEILILERKHASLFLQTNNCGQSPLHIALHFVEVLPKTLDIIVGDNKQTNGMSSVINAVDEDGDSILHWAVRGKRSLPLVQHIVSLGAETSVKNKHGSSLAHNSASFGLLEHLKYFVGLGCDVNAEDNDGDDVLQCAVHDAPRNIVEIVEFLVAVGIAKNHKNKEGKTALDYVRERGCRHDKEEEEEEEECNSDHGDEFHISRLAIENIISEAFSKSEGGRSEMCGLM